MSKLFFMLSLLVSLNVYAKIPTTYQAIDYNCKMSCGELGIAKDCKGLEFAGQLQKDLNGQWVGYHDHFVFYPNNFEFHRAISCKADYVANLIMIDAESLKLSFTEATYKIPQTCSDGSSISSGFDDSVRAFSIYLVQQNQKGVAFTFRSLTSVPTTTIWPNNSGSPVCELTFK